MDIWKGIKLTIKGKKQERRSIFGLHFSCGCRPRERERKRETQVDFSMVFFLLSCHGLLTKEVRSFRFDLIYIIACLDDDFCACSCEVMRRRRTRRKIENEHGKEEEKEKKKRKRRAKGAHAKQVMQMMERKKVVCV